MTAKFASDPALQAAFVEKMRRLAMDIVAGKVAAIAVVYLRSDGEGATLVGIDAALPLMHAATVGGQLNSLVPKFAEAFVETYGDAAVRTAADDVFAGMMDPRADDQCPCPDCTAQRARRRKDSN